jgi:hypothetical protein
VVDEDARVALAPQLDVLAAVVPGVAEPHRDEQPLDARGALRRDGELGERVPAQRRRPLQRRDPRRLLEQQQRAHGVDRHPLRVGLAEHVVEHLERERPRVARGEHVPEQRRQVEPALAREAAVVAAPLQHVHHELRRVGELEVEDPLAGDGADPCRVAAARQDVERVQAGAERRVVRRLHDPPRVLVVVHAAAPGERLVGDPDAVLGGPLGERVQLLGGERVVVDRVGGDARADQQPVGAQLLHHRELALRPPQVRLQPLRRDALEVAERLIQADRQPAVGRRRAHLRRRPGRGDEVGLEQLDLVEAGRRGGGQLVLQRAAQAHRGDRPPHQKRFPNWSIPTIAVVAPSTAIAQQMIASR